MIELMVAGAVVAVVMVGVYRLNAARTQRRQALLVSRFDDDIRKELGEDFPMYAMLPESFRERLDGLIHVFVDEKQFEACGGVEEITPQMQRLIAAQACILLIKRPQDWFSNLRSILVYPGSFGYDEGGVRLGESWSSGSVILSWDAVVKGASNPCDGHDVSIHEFAHQLDQANSMGEGLPELSSGCMYREWSLIMRASFDRFMKKVEKGKKTVIDRYGASNPAEFFAVVTETYLEKPSQLKDEYPDLYQIMDKFYQLDPISWKKC